MPERCKRCNGTGQIMTDCFACRGLGEKQDGTSCPRCGGCGEALDVCPVCNGHGKVYFCKRCGGVRAKVELDENGVCSLCCPPAG